jgi:hypothetical protein
MAVIKERVEGVQIGEQLILIVHTDSKPIWCKAPVVEVAPLTLALPVDVGESFCAGNRVVLVRDTGRGHKTANPTIAHVERVHKLVRVTLTEQIWTTLDNRSAPRFDFETRAILRLVSEHSNECSIEDHLVMLKNLSVNGAKIAQNGSLVVGQLVELRVALGPGNSIRLIGMVVRCESEPYAGIKFVDYVGNARSMLERFIANRAA